MATLIIGDTYAEVEWEGNSKIYRTELLFGDVIAALEKHYPKMKNDKEYWQTYSHDYWYNNNSFGIDFKIWGMTEGYLALTNMYDFLSNSDNAKLNFSIAEKLRLEYCFESYQYYNVDNDDNYISLNRKSYIFKNLNNITQVLCAALYYYSLNGLKLQRCKHCEKWFATKDLSKEYCNRTSPCFDLVVCGKKVLEVSSSCCEAVDTIKRRFRSRKKTIYNQWYNGSVCCPYSDNCELLCPYNDCIIDEDRIKKLNNTFKHLMGNLKKTPNEENILLIHRYLYSDEMPKQVRPNRRKSNAEKRRLMGL